MSATFFSKRSGADLVDNRLCVEEQEAEGFWAVFPEVEGVGGWLVPLPVYDDVINRNGLLCVSISTVHTFDESLTCGMEDSLCSRERSIDHPNVCSRASLGIWLSGFSL